MPFDHFKKHPFRPSRNPLKPIIKCVPPSDTLIRDAQARGIPTGEFEDKVRSAEIKIRVTVNCGHWEKQHQCPLFRSQAGTDLCDHQNNPVECHNPLAIMEALYYGFIIDEQNQRVPDKISIREWLDKFWQIKTNP